MFDLSPIKIMVVLAVSLILLGPDKLPEVAKKLGSTFKAIKNFQAKIESEVREAIPQLPNSGDISRMVRSPIGTLNEWADRATSAQSQLGESWSESAESPSGTNSWESAPDRAVGHASAPLTTTDPSLN